MKIPNDLVEDFIAQTIFTRLSSPERRRSHIQAESSSRALALHAELSGLDDRVIDSAEMVAEGEFTRVQYQAAMKVATDRKGELERMLAKERGVMALAGGLGSPQMIAQKWQTLNLDHQKAILKSILESIHVDKVIEKGMPFNPARIRPIWEY